MSKTIQSSKATFKPHLSSPPEDRVGDSIAMQLQTDGVDHTQTAFQHAPQGLDRLRAVLDDFLLKSDDGVPQDDVVAASAHAQHLSKMIRATSAVDSVIAIHQDNYETYSDKLDKAFALYELSFPDINERQPVEEIKSLLTELDPNDPTFAVQVYLNEDEQAVAYGQGSVLELDDGLVYYWHYGCVADDDFMHEHYGSDKSLRGKSIMNLMHGVHTQILNRAEQNSGKEPLGSMWESEPNGFGHDADSIRFSKTRIQIHNRGGGRVLMGKAEDGSWINLHLQPKLHPDAEPIMLHHMFRPMNYDESEPFESGTLPRETVESLIGAWYADFRDEGGVNPDVDSAELEVQKRIRQCVSFHLLSAEDTPDVVTLAETDPMMRSQLLKAYGVDTLAEAREIYRQAIGPD